MTRSLLSAFHCLWAEHTVWLPPLLVLFALAFAGHSARLLARWFRGRERHEAPALLVRGIRALIVAIAACCIAAGLTFGPRGLFLFGLFFLGEELYETGLILLILRERTKREFCT